ncbi:MAG: hypothetical protein WAZ27_00875 [Minisyncoccia bacterium]
MKTPTKIILIVALLFPAFASAQDPFDRYIEEHHIEISNEGAIYSETNASASTGGQTAAAGQSVTDGDVSSSSHVETYVSTNDEGGTVQIQIETSKNGETKTEEYIEEIAPGEPVNVNVSAKATNDDSEIEVKVQGETVIGDEASTSQEVEGESEIEIEAGSIIEQAFTAIPSFFKKVLSFFWGW